MIISIIVAMTSDRVIGNHNSLPWSIPEDMRRFKEITMDHPVIMGRKTYLSIPERFRPLKGRKNIVLTKDLKWNLQEDIIIVHSIDSAIAEARIFSAPEAFVIGGESVYSQFLPMADRIYLTLVSGNFEGDAFFPVMDQNWEEVSRKGPFTDKDRGISYSFFRYER